MSLLKIDRIDSRIASVVTFLKEIVSPKVTTNIIAVDQIDKRTGANPTFLTSPLAPTPTVGDNSTKLATTAFVNSEIIADVGIANSPVVMTALNAGGTAPIYACRAWANFNGTGTVSIRASGNVSSITDNGIGNYTMNFTTAMVDANYCLNVETAKHGAYVDGHDITLSTTSATVSYFVQTGVYVDTPYVMCSIFR